MQTKLSHAVVHNSAFRKTVLLSIVILLLLVYAQIRAFQKLRLNIGLCWCNKILLPNVYSAFAELYVGNRETP